MKGLAVVLMVQVHIMELFARQEIFDSAWGKVSLFLGGPFAAPVFLSVMGYFLAASHRTLKSLQWRGVKLVGLGLALNIGLNLHLLIRIFQSKIDEGPWTYIFGADILFVAGFSIMAIGWLKALFKDRIYLFVILTLLFSSLVSLIPAHNGQANFWTYLLSFLGSKTSWSYFPFIPWFSYPLLGYTFYLVAQEYPAIISRVYARRIPVIIILVVALSLLSSYPLQVITHLPDYYHHGIPTFLWIIAFMLLLLLIIKVVENEINGTIVSRYLQFLGRNVTAFYVVQWLIIGNIATAIYKTQHIFWLFAWFAGILAVSSILTFSYSGIHRGRR